jgi:oxygen-independent coproporphyrinogen-3 oxidase
MALAGPPVALYVHIPFCLSLCPYCDFVVYAGAAARGPRARVDAFVGALRTELAVRADALDAAFGHERPPLETLYLGGGTPSLMPADVVAGLIDVVRARYGIAGGAEITLEANPGAGERGDADALRAGGVTRLSLGAQSMSDAGLRRLGRRHRAVDVGAAVAAARDAGIGSISLDLLYDTPDGSLIEWIDTLEAALALEPDHLSLYALTLDDPDAEGLTGPGGDHLPTTAGARRWRAEARPQQDEDRAAAQYHHAVHRLAEDGWRGYEISNWARPGHESRHNLVYWERRPYEAAGRAHTVRRRHATLERGAARGYLAALARPLGVARLPPAARALDPATEAARRSSWACGRTGACRRGGLSAADDVFGWAPRRAARRDRRRPHCAGRAVASCPTSYSAGW